MVRCAFVTTGLTLLLPFAAGAQGTPVMKLDLTSPPPRTQQGLGVPGGSSEGGEGVWPSHQYELPIQILIENASVTKNGDFIIEVDIKNVSREEVELPVSSQISDIERTSGTFRRELIFGIRSASTQSEEPSVVAVTAGSHAIPKSLVKVEPNQSIRASLRISSNWVRKSLANNENELYMNVTCGELSLEDGRFSIQSMAQEIVSQNTAVLGFSGDTPTAKVSKP